LAGSKISARKRRKNLNLKHGANNHAANKAIVHDVTAMTVANVVDSVLANVARAAIRNRAANRLRRNNPAHPVRHLRNKLLLPLLQPDQKQHKKASAKQVSSNVPNAVAAVAAGNVANANRVKHRPNRQ
jgi:hypothetical protein